MVRHQGKLIRRSLDTQDKAEAKRLLGDFRRSLEKVNFKANRCTLRELTKRYLETVKFQAAKTFEAKELVMRHVQSDWPGGCDGQVRDVRSSTVKSWLSAQKERMGKSSFNGYVQTIRALFAMAVEDRLIATSPAAGIKQLKRNTPIRESPTWEQFRLIVEDIRSQRFSAEASDSADFVEFIGLAGPWKRGSRFPQMAGRRLAGWTDSCSQAQDRPRFFDSRLPAVKAPAGAAKRRRESAGG